MAIGASGGVTNPATASGMLKALYSAASAKFSNTRRFAALATNRAAGTPLSD